MLASYNNNKASFPMVEELAELIELLNGTRPSNNLSLRELTGGQVQLYTGDQPLYRAENDTELKTFLLGMFVVAWGGDSLESIRRQAAANQAEQEQAAR